MEYTLELRRQFTVSSAHMQGRHHSMAEGAPPCMQDQTGIPDKSDTMVFLLLHARPVAAMQ